MTRRPASSSPRLPSVGDMVHYVSYGAQNYPPRCCAALVIETEGAVSMRVGLDVRPPGGQLQRILAGGGAEYDDGVEGSKAPWACDGVDHAPGTWHWISRRQV